MKYIHVVICLAIFVTTPFAVGYIIAKLAIIISSNL
jgi:hypothetical protein